MWRLRTRVPVILGFGLSMGRFLLSLISSNPHCVLAVEVKTGLKQVRACGSPASQKTSGAHGTLTAENLV